MYYPIIFKPLSLHFKVISAKFSTLFFPKNIKIGYKNLLPYITKALQQSIKTKHLLNFAYKKNPTKTNKLKFTTFNNKLTLLLRNKEKDYIEEQLELNRINLTKCWMIIRDIVGKGKPVSNNKIHFKIAGKETTNQLFQTLLTVTLFR